MENPAYNEAIRLLTRQDYSEYKLRKKLSEKNYPHDQIDLAIEKVKSYNYLREDLYLEARIKGLMRKNLSASHIKRKLEQEFLYPSEEYIYSIFSENSFTQNKQINDLIHKKLRNKDLKDLNFEEKRKIKEKIIRHLQSKGHSYSQSISSIENYLIEAQ